MNEAFNSEAPAAGGVVSTHLGDHLQVLDVGALGGQQLLGNEVGLVCGKLLHTEMDASCYYSNLLNERYPLIAPLDLKISKFLQALLPDCTLRVVICTWLTRV